MLAYQLLIVYQWLKDKRLQIKYISVINFELEIWHYGWRSKCKILPKWYWVAQPNHTMWWVVNLLYTIHSVECVVLCEWALQDVRFWNCFSEKGYWYKCHFRNSPRWSIAFWMCCSTYIIAMQRSLSKLPTNTLALLSNMIDQANDGCRKELLGCKHNAIKAISLTCSKPEKQTV